MKHLAIAGFTIFLAFLLFQPVLGAVSSYLSVTPSNGIVPKGGSIAFSTTFPETKYLRVQIYRVSNLAYLLKDSGWVAGTEYSFDLSDFNTGSYLYAAFARTSSSTSGAPSASDTVLGWNYFYVNGAPFQFESGTLSVGSNWKTVSLTKTFTNPVVIIKSVEGCDDPSTAKDLCDYLTPRVRNVTSNSFEVMLQAVPKGSSLSGSKNVSYIVVEEGRFKIEGFDIEAGKLNTSNFALLQSNPITATKFYPKFEKEPVVITTITSFNGSDPATTRNKTHYFQFIIALIPIEIHIGDFRDGFVSLIDEPGWDPFLEHKNEEISYLAITPGVGVLGGKKVYVGEENVSSSAKSISFDGVFSDKPGVVADMQRMYGSDWSIVRYAALTNKSAKLLVAEKNGGDHVVEPVGYILVGGTGDTNPVGLVANFTATPMQGAPPLDVSFDASNSTNAVSYAWDFGDGSNGSGVKTSHRFESKGTYTVTLTVKDASGNTATAQKDIVVEGKGCESNEDCPCGDGCYDGNCLHPLISVSKSQDQVVGFRGKPKDISTTWTLTNTGDHTAFVMGFWTPGCEGQSCEIKLVESGGKIVTPATGSVPEPTPTPTVSPSPSPTPSTTPSPSFSFTSVKVVPNPFTGGSAVFEAVGSGIVEIDVRVFDLAGLLVFDSGFVPGSSFAWDGKNGSGDQLANGSYLYKITARGAAGEEKTIGPETMVILFKAVGEKNGTIFFAGTGSRPTVIINTSSLAKGLNTISATVSDPDGDLGGSEQNVVYLFIKSPSGTDPSDHKYNKVNVARMNCTGSGNSLNCSYDVCVDASWGSDAKIAVTAEDSVGYGDYAYKTVQVTGDSGIGCGEQTAGSSRPTAMINTSSLSEGSNNINVTVSDPDGDAKSDKVYLFVKAPADSSTFLLKSKKMACSGSGSSLICSFPVTVTSEWGGQAAIFVIAQDSVDYGPYAVAVVPIIKIQSGSGGGSPSPSVTPPVSPSIPVTPSQSPFSSPSPVTPSQSPFSSPSQEPSPTNPATGSGVAYACGNYNFGVEVPLTTPLFAIEPGQSVKVEEIVRGVLPPSEKRELSLGFAVHYTDAFGKSNKVARAHTETNIVLANLLSERFHVKLGLKEQSSCVGWNDLYGATGPGVVPRVLFNWSFSSSDNNAVAIDQCDNGNENFTYCDATQFSIELLKKLHRINELASSGESVESFKEFRAYLIADNFSGDFRKDFNYYYTHGFFSAPSWYDGISTPWSSYFTDVNRLKFEPAQITESGLYDVRLEFSFDGGEYEFFHEGEPRASIVVRFEKVHPVGVEVVDSPFYHLPFNGLVGTQRVDEDGKKERKDYGLGFVNENGELKLAYMNGNLVSTSPSHGATTILTKKETGFAKLNVVDRGRVLTVDLGNGTMLFSPSYAMPVIMGLESSSGSAQAFYLPVKGEDLISMSAPSSFWTGIAASPSLGCKDFVGNALPYLEADKRADLVGGSCSVLEGREHAFGLLWPNALDNNKRLFLKTIFYSAFDDAMKISAACDSTSGVREVFASPLGLSTSSDHYLVLQAPGLGVGSFKDLVDRIKDSEVCMASSGGKYVFFWNPERVEEGLGAAGQRIGAEWSFNWENYKCD